MLLLSIFVFNGCNLNSPPSPIADNPWDPDNPLPPRAPSNLIGEVVSETSTHLTWWDNSGNEDGFKIVIRRPGNIPFLQEVIVNSNSTEAMIDGLWKNTTYQCQIFAFNEAGTSIEDQIININTGEVKPTPPSGLSVKSTSATEVLLTWQDMSENETGFYILEAFDDSTDFQLISDPNPNETELSINVPDKFTTYYYRVSAHNSFGISPQAGTVWITPGSSPPETPQNFNATAISESEVELSWVDNSDNVEEFVVIMGVNDSLILSQEFTLEANLDSYTLTDLLANSTFYYKIRAQNRFSQSELSSLVSASTSNVPPTMPTDLTAESVTESSIIIRWNDDSSIETSYQMEQSFQNTDNFVVIGSTREDVEEYNVSNLVREETYFYRLRARGMYGSSPWTDVLQVVTSSLPPVAPEGLAANIVSLTEVSLDWIDNSNIETGFEIYRSVRNQSNWGSIMELPANLISYNDTELAQQTTYYYKIRSMNDYGTSEFSEVVVIQTTHVPLNPSELTATGISATEIELTWQDRSDNELGFIIEELSDNENWQAVDTVEAGVVHNIRDQRTQFTRYEYRLISYNQWGRSDYSNAVSATPYALITFVASSEAGLIAVNITDESSPEELSQIDTPGNAMHVEVSEDYAYVADSFAGLRAIDISDPRILEEVGSYDTDGQARSLVIDNEFAYVADDDNGMIIIDISTPSNPIFVGAYQSDEYEIFDVAIDGRLAYLAAGSAGVVKVDISNHRSPVFSEVLDTFGAAAGVTVDNGYCYVADQSGGLTVIDLSDFSEAGYSRFQGIALQLEVRAGFAYIANYRDGLNIIDVSSPDNPQFVTGIDTPGEARGITLYDNIALVADYAGGLLIIDIAEPDDLDEIRSIQLPGRAQDSAIKVYR